MNNKYARSLFMLCCMALVHFELYAQQTITIGTATGTTGTTTASPVGRWYSSYRTQVVYTKAEINTAGFSSAGQIRKLGFNINTVGTGGAQTLNNFTIRIKHTTATDISAGWDNGASTVVYSQATYNPIAGGFEMYTLTTPFQWNGVDNILVDVCNDNAPNNWNNSGSVWTFNSTNGHRFVGDDGSNRCGQTTGAVNGVIGTKWQVRLEMLGSSAPPIAAFYTDPTGCVNSPFAMVNNSLGASSFEWSASPNTYTFINGTSSTSKHPQFSFSDTVIYTVKLRSINFFGVDSLLKTVKINKPSSAPVANFFASRLISPEATELIPFYDLSTNCPQSWEWSSPDYELATGLNPFTNPTAQNPTAFFILNGTWQICLKATNTAGSHTVCKTAYVTVLPSKTLCTDTITNLARGFIADEGAFNNNYFNNRTLANCKGFVIDPCASSVTLTFEKWKLALGAGDSIIIHNGPNQFAPSLLRGGSNLNGTLPVVTANSGKMFIYMITNFATADSGFVASWTSTPATYPKPTANFNISKQNGMGTDTFSSGYRMMLNNTSTGTDVNYRWDVNGDGGDDSTMASPTSIFFNFTASPVQYTIRLISRNCIGNDTTYRTVTILPVNSKPSPIDFVADIRVVTSTDTVSLTDLSIGATAWEWSFTPNNVTFAQGFSRFSQNPKVLFAGGGCIKVQLKVINSFGSDSVAKTSYICLKTYCPPGSATTPSSDIGFSQVAIGSINNFSAIGVSEYSDYSDSSFGNATLYRGSTYTINVKRNTNSSNISWKGWIDWNQDGDFYDNGEEIFSQFNSSTVNSSFQVTVPTNARLARTRLRVGATAGTNFLDPCAAYLGEFEDYRITIGTDNSAPVITMTGADTVYIEVGSSYADLGATAMDNLEGNITPKVVISSTVDTSIVGIFKVCYDVQDLYGNKATTKCRVVIVKVDLTKPVINISGPNPITIPVYSQFTMPNYTAIDNYSGNITTSVKISGSVDTSMVGTYTITFSVADFFGYTDTKTLTVNVVDTMKPVLNRVTSTANHIHLVGMPLVNANVINSTDNYYQNLVPVRTGLVDVNVLGVYPVVYNLTDGSGNVALSLAVNIEVKDTLAPVITLTGADTLLLEVFTTYIEPTPTVADNFYNGLAIIKTGSFNRNIVGTYTITYSATDGSGNNATASRVIQIVDIRKPAISLKQNSFVSWPQGKPWVDPGVQIVDNYYSETRLLDSLKTSSNLDVSTAGVYSIKYRVTDPSGNMSDEVERTVFVGLTSAKDLQFGGKVNVYPNPSAGAFKVDVQMTRSTDVEVVVMDLLGQELTHSKQNNIQNHNFSIDLSDRAAGVYLVKVVAGNEVTVMKVNVIH